MAMRLNRRGIGHFVGDKDIERHLFARGMKLVVEEKWEQWEKDIVKKEAEVASECMGNRKKMVEQDFKIQDFI